jgi:hypothetical protein
VPNISQILNVNKILKVVSKINKQTETYKPTCKFLYALKKTGNNTREMLEIDN